MAYTVSKNTYLPLCFWNPPLLRRDRGGSKLGGGWNKPLLAIEAGSHRSVHLAPVQHFDSQPTLNQQLVSLGTKAELPELCDLKDLTITVLEGQGSLMLQEEIVYLEPELFVFIPVQTPYTLRSHTALILLLSHYEPDPATSESAWVINL